MSTIALVNPTFEQGWHQQGAPELEIPDGWELDYRDGDHPWCGPQGKRPEVKPNQEFSVSGSRSVRAFPPAHSRGLFALYQNVDAEPGAWYTFRAWARVESNPPGEMAAFVGIQPWAGSVFDRQMIWGQEVQKTREWTRIEVTAPAFGNRIRVALGANNKWATQNNTVWWDDCDLQLAEFGQAQPDLPPDVPPQVPGEFDWITLTRTVREVIRAQLADRPPVKWPR